MRQDAIFAVLALCFWVFVAMPSPAQAQAFCGIPGVGCNTNTNFGALPLNFWACDSGIPNCAQGDGHYIGYGHTPILRWTSGFVTVSGQSGWCSIYGGEYPIDNPIYITSSYVTPPGSGSATGGQVPVSGGGGTTYQMDCQESYQTGYSVNGATLSIAKCPGTQIVNGSGQCVFNTNAYNPIGIIDSTGSGLIQGWSIDQDDGNVSNWVHIYLTNPPGADTIMAGVQTSVSRPDVNGAYGISGNHGYAVPIPPTKCDGVTHAVKAYGINLTNGGTNTMLANSPMNFNCINNCPIEASVGPSNGDGRILPTGTYSVQTQGYDFCITNYGAQYFIPTNTPAEVSRFITAAQTYLSGSMTYFSHRHY